MPDIRSQPLVRAWENGAAEFDSGRYWHAHEAWEQGWVRLEQPLKDRIQALIQACGVFFHLEKGRPGPALSLARRALEKLRSSAGAEALAPRIEVPGLEAALGRLVAGLESDPERILKEWRSEARTLRARVVILC